MSAISAPGPQAAPAASPRRRLLGWFARHRRLQLGTLLALPVGWLGVVYFGALILLLLSAFWVVDPVTGQIVRDWTLANFQKIITHPDPYLVIVARTVVIAALVTVSDAVIAFPIAYFMARVASRRTRNILAVAVLIPLWASYLVRVYSWRLILSQNGLLDWFFTQLGIPGVGDIFGYSDLSMTVVFVYLWLPYMILPIWAGLERIPDSFLEASADLGGRPLMTFRRVVLPLAMPALVAGSIFTFSLTLGDYIVPQLVSNTQFIGNVIFSQLGVAGDIPFAAAFAVIPIVIMGIYLYAASRVGAFEAL
ncbi:MAG TPA: ABC transporter permease [Candidatus Dormibacteraeota bacterium]|nr:ABC transporter permease [Candidatus Dormibacteraeota bacterium]